MAEDVRNPDDSTSDRPASDSGDALTQASPAKGPSNDAAAPALDLTDSLNRAIRWSETRPPSYVDPGDDLSTPAKEIKKIRRGERNDVLLAWVMVVLAIAFVLYRRPTEPGFALVFGVFAGIMILVRLRNARVFIARLERYRERREREKGSS